MKWGWEGGGGRGRENGREVGRGEWIERKGRKGGCTAARCAVERITLPLPPSLDDLPIAYDVPMGSTSLGLPRPLPSYTFCLGVREGEILCVVYCSSLQAPFTSPSPYLHSAPSSQPPLVTPRLPPCPRAIECCTLRGIE